MDKEDFEGEASVASLKGICFPIVLFHLQSLRPCTWVQDFCRLPCPPFLHDSESSRTTRLPVAQHPGASSRAPDPGHFRVLASGRHLVWIHSGIKTVSGLCGQLGPPHAPAFLGGHGEMF